MTRKICVVTGSRADYGLLRWVMQGIKEDNLMSLQILATGSHLSSLFGLTFKEIEADGFVIDKKIEVLSDSDASLGTLESIASGITGCANAFRELQPDLIIVLGDRFEVFAAATAALVMGIPVAHVHGGEITLGAFDEALRHSITKMSHLHFVAAEEYRKRVIQLGENPSNVFLVGGLGIDSMVKQQLIEKSKLAEILGVDFQEKNLLITFHPVTLEGENSERQMSELLLALSELKNTTLIFTMPNADPNSRKLIKMIDEFTLKHLNSKSFVSLGQQLYLSLISVVDGVLGNSSSGLTEVPSFNKGTVNIGDRQTGRLKAESVIDCLPSKQSILDAVSRLYSFEFQSNLLDVTNPYGEGGASTRIVDILRATSLEGITKKKFHDL
jgi:GDP/UDP-N,N'-diacetylbacillosamine 2-epimerase (hydrolysing)